ncbi:MAG TPA: hypothetical protein VK508_06785 [Cyclobacteriaceae bacterium]|nr:hypothetical protein [Cyclobacteriaceae bacterium]
MQNVIKASWWSTKLLNVFAGLAIFISCMRLLGLAMFLPGNAVKS